jgi:hypothetical protein
MKVFSVMIVLAFASYAQATPDENCNYKNKLVSKDVMYQLCKTTNQYSSLPQVKFYSQKSEIIENKTIAQIRGYVVTPDQKSVMFKDFTQLSNATLRVDFAAADMILSNSEHAELKLNERDASEFGSNLDYGKHTLKNAHVSTQQLPSYTMLAPALFNQYISAKHKISTILVEPLTCTTTKAQLQALESCQEQRMDQGQYDCNCTYEILN